ncbi:hypothetical protein P0W64_21075 [Tsukamurella sp. 8F]|uniref:hypothetical protein n=1 Tax=unclassified Tsukamurella TaxID=2633480 RepID=UPI0023B8FA73|nr:MULTISPECIES: hypothetical protein [unclassified Tsukamurella]MDF0529616.1 hypothetical protein [Tsukamurella sp. 8J]MDF0589277.1 hypothetical protein [Tsukamurella sp. 8F]
MAKGSRLAAVLRRTACAAAVTVAATSTLGGVATAAPATPAPSSSATAPSATKAPSTKAPTTKSPAAPSTKTQAPSAAVPPAPKSVGPGDRIDILQRSLGDGKFQALQCTMGFAVTSGTGERLGVTAGHCGSVSKPVGVDHWVVGQIVESHAPAVKPDPKRPGQMAPVDPFAPDWATFRLTDKSVKMLGSKGRIAPYSVGTAKVGDKVCQQGSVNGYRCGKVVQTKGDWILTDITTTQGDSGGPLIRTSDHAALGIITDAVTLSDSDTGQVKGKATQYYSLQAALRASGATLATR